MALPHIRDPGGTIESTEHDHDVPVLANVRDDVYA